MAAAAAEPATGAAPNHGVAGHEVISLCFPARANEGGKAGQVVGIVRGSYLRSVLEHMPFISALLSARERGVGVDDDDSGALTIDGCCRDNFEKLYDWVHRGLQTDNRPVRVQIATIKEYDRLCDAARYLSMELQQDNLPVGLKARVVARGATRAAADTIAAHFERLIDDAGASGVADYRLSIRSICSGDADPSFARDVTVPTDTTVARATVRDPRLNTTLCDEEQCGEVIRRLRDEHGLDVERGQVWLPTVLHVSGGPECYRHLPGCYELCDGEVVNGQPLWQKGDGEKFICSTPPPYSKWQITDARSNFLRIYGWGQAFTSESHEGVMPNEFDCWHIPDPGPRGTEAQQRERHAAASVRIEVDGDRAEAVVTLRLRVVPATRMGSSYPTTPAPTPAFGGYDDLRPAGAGPGGWGAAHGAAAAAAVAHGGIPTAAAWGGGEWATDAAAKGGIGLRHPHQSPLPY